MKPAQPPGQEPIKRKGVLGWLRACECRKLEDAGKFGTFLASSEDPLANREARPNIPPREVAAGRGNIKMRLLVGL
jgi:hypothetical protein